jgi:hypothetical protein
MDYYNRCVVYKLSCKNQDITDCYIGSTKNYSERKRHHKSICNNENSPSYNLKVYKKIRELGWDCWDMIVLEEVNCKTKEQLLLIEGEYIKLLEPSLNCNIAGRTKKEYEEVYRINNKDKFKVYYENNKNKLKQMSKNYNIKNKDKIKEYKKQHHQKNKDKFNQINKEYREKNKDKIKEKSKEYQKKNKDKIKEKSKEYYQKNKADIQKKVNEKIHCMLCDCWFNKGNKSNHNKTEKHIKMCIEVGG